MPHHRIPVTLAPFIGDLLSGTILGALQADGLMRPVTRTTLAAAPAADSATVTVAAGTAEKFRWLTYPANATLHVYSAKPDGTGEQDLGPIVGITGDKITVTHAPDTAPEAGDLLYVGGGCEKAMLVLADSVPDADRNRVATAYYRGAFVGKMLIGFDSQVAWDLHARVIPRCDQELIIV
ncbi:hypothetical protein [Tumebacillus flagellatus]|nr:hypothetical protein [Tumebacillus flagellatus]